MFRVAFPVAVVGAAVAWGFLLAPPHQAAKPVTRHGYRLELQPADCRGNKECERMQKELERAIVVRATP